MFKSINGGQLPQRATKYSAGVDVFANEDVVIGAGETKLIGLGIALDISDDFLAAHIVNRHIAYMDKEDVIEAHYFALHIRSSLRAKGLTSLGTGIIDMDYRDEIKMVIHNPIESIQRVYAVNDFFYYAKGQGEINTVPNEEMNNGGYKIKKGDKIGQLILCRHEGWLLPSEYTKDVERDGGFGSTGA